MDLNDVKDLYAITQAVDGRESIAEIQVWYELLRPFDKDQCSDAIEAHRREMPGVWLEPGHIIARVKAKNRDRLDRMDPDERAYAVADARAAAEEGITRRDKFGVLDKSLPDDDEYPAEWTSEQRLNAYWAKINGYRDEQEFEQAVSQPGTLLIKPPATAEERSRALAQFAAAQGMLGGGEVIIDESVPHVNVIAVACDFCRASSGEPCTMPGLPAGRFSRPGSKQPAVSVTAVRDRLRGFHPGRVEKAAIAQGLGETPDDPLVKALVAIECGRQVNQSKQGWNERDMSAPPVTTPAALADDTVIDAEIVDEAPDAR